MWTCFIAVSMRIAFDFFMPRTEIKEHTSAY